MPRQLSNVEALYLQYDRTVPRAAMREAEERDRLGLPSGVEFADTPAPPPRFASDRALIVKMAQVMVERTTASGACTDDHLMAAGFSREEIERYRGAAAVVAARVTADSVREKIKAAKARRRRGAKHAVVG
jgi:hypothetical protein